MWQLFALGGLVLYALEEIVDKAVIVENDRIEIVSASFIRNLIYFVLMVLVGASGLAGRMHFFMRWPIVFYAFLSMLGGIFYTYLLKKIELTGASALGYTTPFIFLLIDVFVAKAAISPHQVAGIALLACGGVLFTLDLKKIAFKREYSKYVWAISAFNLVLYTSEFYTFKHYSALGVNEVSYLASAWLLVVLFFVPFLLWQGRWRHLWRTASEHWFLPKETLSKSFDVFGSLLWFHAISLAAVSEVNALGSFAPLILLVLLFISQKVFRINAGENFDSSHVLQKSCATLLLVAGAWLAS